MEPVLERAQEGARFRVLAQTSYRLGHVEVAQLQPFAPVTQQHPLQLRAEAIDAPAIARPAQHVPVIDGVAPELSLGAEIIGGHTSHEAWPLLFVQQEQLRVGPNVA